jgi:hypothetical protein
MARLVPQPVCSNFHFLPMSESRTHGWTSSSPYNFNLNGQNSHGSSSSTSSSRASRPSESLQLEVIHLPIKFDIKPYQLIRPSHLLMYVPSAASQLLGPLVGQMRMGGWCVSGSWGQIPRQTAAAWLQVQPKTCVSHWHRVSARRSSGDRPRRDSDAVEPLVRLIEQSSGSPPPPEIRTR